MPLIPGHRLRALFLRRVSQTPCSPACITFHKKNALQPKMLLLALFSLVLLGYSQSVKAELSLGHDLPFQWHEDNTAQQTVDDIIHLPPTAWQQHNRAISLGYTNSALWLKLRLPKALFSDGKRLLEIGPNYIDSISFYYRPEGLDSPWQKKNAGDLWPEQRGDMDYRYPVFVLDPPPGATGYDIMLEARSSSALLLNLSLWSHEEFLEHATASTTFWSFYLGLAGISCCLALLLAILLRRRLLWSIFLFSSSYLLVACIQGYVDWLLGASWLHWQHYLTSIFTLLSYSSLLWMCTEALELKRYMPRLYAVVMTFAILTALQLLSIPLGYYGLAIKVIGIVFSVAAVALAWGAMHLRRKHGLKMVALLIGLTPLLYVVSVILALFSLYGLIPYHEKLYGVWQYSIMINMLTVLSLAVYKVSEENRQIREKTQLTRELQIEREASSYQRQFIGMVSHEFRTPLAIISASVENLRLAAQPNDPHCRRYDRISRATERLIQLTDNCLADARLSAGNLYLDAQRICLLTLVKEVAAIVEISEQYQLELTINGRNAAQSVSSPIQVMADSGLLRIAFSNLLDNAMKYAEKGTISISIKEENQQYVVAIRDQGPGIPSEHAHHIFERYRQLDTPNGKKGGAGLGLYVVRQIAQAHGGEARLASHLTQGCQFELYLPTR